MRHHKSTDKVNFRVDVQGRVHRESMCCCGRRRYDSVNFVNGRRNAVCCTSTTRGRTLAVEKFFQDGRKKGRSASTSARNEIRQGMNIDLSQFGGTAFPPS